MASQIQTREKQAYYIWIGDDDENQSYIHRRLKEAVRIGSEEVINTIIEILDKKDAYGEDDYDYLDEETVNYAKSGAYEEFEEKTNIDSGNIYMIEDGRVYVYSVAMGEYLAV